MQATFAACVAVETSVGSMVIGLYDDVALRRHVDFFCTNCTVGLYNGCRIGRVQKDGFAELATRRGELVGDVPSGGGAAVWESAAAHFFGSNRDLGPVMSFCEAAVRGSRAPSTATPCSLPAGQLLDPTWRTLSRPTEGARRLAMPPQPVHVAKRGLVYLTPSAADDASPFDDVSTDEDGTLPARPAGAAPGVRGGWGVTLTDRALPQLTGRVCVIGEVLEGAATLARLDALAVARVDISEETPRGRLMERFSEEDFRQAWSNAVGGGGLQAALKMPNGAQATFGFPIRAVFVRRAAVVEGAGPQLQQVRWRRRVARLAVRRTSLQAREDAMLRELGCAQDVTQLGLPPPLTVARCILDRLLLKLLCSVERTGHLGPLAVAALVTGSVGASQIAGPVVTGLSLLLTRIIDERIQPFAAVRLRSAEVPLQVEPWSNWDERFGLASSGDDADDGMIQESDSAVAVGYRRPRDTDPSKAAAFQRLKRRVEERRADRTRLVLLELMSQRFDKGTLLKNRPPQNVLFVCKLSQDTTSERLSRAFHTAGFTVISCEVLVDKNTRRSLQYGFVEFPDAKTCEDAYRKMEGHRVDDKRIHVDFSQSVLGASRAS